MNNSALFKPFTLKSLTVPNRFVMAPMTRAQSPGNIPNQTNILYYKARAAGGVGLIISEGTYINPHASESSFSDPKKVPHFYGKEAILGWKKIAAAIHEAGGKFIPQLWHVGSVRQSGIEPNPENPGYGPSAIVHPYASKSEMPLAMTQYDIEDTIADYAKAAFLAKEIGCDGVELHGAHGYLIDQFFWDYTNQRQDIYGGKYLRNRTRFACEIIKEVRKQVGEDFPLILRYSQWKLGAYYAKLAKNPAELANFLEPLTDAGVDIFHCSTRRLTVPEFPGYPENLAHWSKKITGKPVIAVGSLGLNLDFIQTYLGEKTVDRVDHRIWIEDIANRIEKAEFDLVALGRALIAESNLVRKISISDYESITNYEASMLNQYPNVAK